MQPGAWCKHPSQSMTSNLAPLEAFALITGVVSGLGGLGLSVYNTVYARRGGKARLCARFSIMSFVDRTNGPGGQVEEDVGVVTVSNLGRVPCVPTTVGIKVSGGKTLLVLDSTPIDGGSWPRELASGHAVMLRFVAKSLLEEIGENTLKRSFVCSQIGEVFHGSRKAMREFRGSLDALEVRLHDREVDVDHSGDCV